MKTEVILASQSENKSSLFSMLGVPFRVEPAFIDEDAIFGETYVDRAMAIARAKAREVAKTQQGLIIAADTFAVFEGREYQKPKDLTEARSMLSELSGKKGVVVTGICIYDTHTQKEILDHREVAMTCKHLNPVEIEDYVTTRPVTEWAACHNPLDELSASIFCPVGNYEYKIATYGLPVDIVSKALETIGFHVDISQFRA